ncbi:hypothetical protein JTB14_029921 [Gonioctena quinquepunctata]|nr:hypothetical protein JTB14_029921 [Gonioctena quinquepunctata]
MMCRLYFVILIVLFKDASGILEELTSDSIGFMKIVPFLPTLNSNDEKCREHTQQQLKEIQNFTLWATEMFDASAKFPSGVLAGSSYALGNFDQCVGIKVPYPSGEFGGKYCMAKITVIPPSDDNPHRDIDFVHEEYQNYHNISTWRKISMPRNYKRKTDRASWTSATLQEALAAIENGRAVGEVSRSSAIPRATLQDRRRNGKVAKGQLGRRPVFSREQELSEQIINYSKLFFWNYGGTDQAKCLHFCQIK